MDVVVVNVCLPDITGDWGYAVYQDFVPPSVGGSILVAVKPRAAWVPESEPLPRP